MSGYYTKCRECGQFTKGTDTLCATCAKSGMGLVAMLMLMVILAAAAGIGYVSVPWLFGF